MLAKTVAAKLVPVADNLRDLQVKLGIRTYQVRIIKTRWTGGYRGDGVEIIVSSMDVLPTPLVDNVGNLSEQVQSYGLVEDGTMQISEISGRYTESEVLGWASPSQPPADDEQVFWEVEYPQTDGRGVRKRRFLPITAPAYNAENLQWTVTVTRSNPERGIGGELN
jgi:hypothetical protein